MRVRASAGAGIRVVIVDDGRGGFRHLRPPSSPVDRTDRPVFDVLTGGKLRGDQGPGAEGLTRLSARKEKADEGLTNPLVRPFVSEAHSGPRRPSLHAEPVRGPRGHSREAGRRPNRCPSPGK